MRRIGRLDKDSAELPLNSGRPKVYALDGPNDGAVVQVTEPRGFGLFQKLQMNVRQW